MMIGSIESNKKTPVIDVMRTTVFVWKKKDRKKDMIFDCNKNSMKYVVRVIINYLFNRFVLLLLLFPF